MDLERYFNEVAQWMTENLRKEVFDEVCRFSNSSFDECNRAENRELIERLNGNEYIRNFFSICLLKKIVSESKQDYYESGIGIINNLKSMGFNLSYVEKQFAETIVISTNFIDLSQFQANYNFLKQIDSPNCENNLFRFSREAKKTLQLKEEEDFDFIKYISEFNLIDLQEKHKNIVNEYLEKLLFDLILITYKQKELKPFLSFKAVYEKFYKNRQEEIAKHFNALVAGIFKEMLNSCNEISDFPDFSDLENRKISEYFIYYNIRNTQKRYLELMTEIVLIKSMIERYRNQAVAALGFKLRNSFCTVVVGLSPGFQNLDICLRNLGQINSVTYAVIFIKILQFYLPLKDLAISYCFHAECVLLDEVSNFILLPSQIFCVRSKSELEIRGENRCQNEYRLDLSIMMEEVLVYLNKQDPVYDDIRSSIELIRGNEGVTVEHVIEFLSHYTQVVD